MRTETRSARRPRSPTPAACRMPTTVRLKAAILASSSASPLSEATASTKVPSSCSCLCSPCPSRAIRPLREPSITWVAPRAMSSCAARRPSPPSPPVTAYTPHAAVATLGSPAAAVCRRSRDERIAFATQASSASLTAMAFESNAGIAIELNAPRDTSTLCARSPLCSRRTTRARPHTPPCAASDAAPEPSADATCAPQVTTSS